MHAVFGCIVVNWNNLKIDDKWKWLKSLIYEQVNRYEFDPRQRRLLTQQGAGESQQLNRLHRERKKKRKRKRESAIKKKQQQSHYDPCVRPFASHIIVCECVRTWVYKVHAPQLAVNIQEITQQQTKRISSKRNLIFLDTRRGVLYQHRVHRHPYRLFWRCAL